MQEAQETAMARPRVALLCGPCMGHLIPFAELARRLVADHGLAATLIVASSTSSPSMAYLAIAAAMPDGVDLVALPEPPRGALPPRPTLLACATHAVTAGLPRVRSLLLSLAASAPLAALVVDMLGAPARDLASELGVPLYMLFTSSWMTLSLMLHLPELDAARAGEYHDAAEPIHLPGCVPIGSAELPSSLLADRSSDMYAGLLCLAKQVTGVDGFLVNTFQDLEPGIGDCMDGLGLDLPVHQVGPLVWSRPVSLDRDHECLRWLDRQPRGSVVYLSFGSGGTLTWQQTAELALGLEMSRHRFLWAAKWPDDKQASGAFFGTQSGPYATSDFLPEGFLKRTKGVGLVTNSWAPQTTILEHESVGCFVTHCGWNSVLESIVNGVPMVAWPLYAEQPMNVAMLVSAGVAARVRVAGEQLVNKEKVASVIQCVMGEEGRTMRNHVGELKNKATHALSKDGCCSRVITQVVNEWKTKPKS